MKLEITSNYDTMSALAAERLAEEIRQNPSAVLCLPTGGSVEGTYAALVALLKERRISMAGIHAFNMDEYATLSRDNGQSYYYFMKKHLYDKTDIDLANTHSPDAAAADLSRACRKYTEAIQAAGGFDFTLLGIGTDGHIAFNMPRPALSLDTHLEQLSQETIAANSRFFPSKDAVPRQALSIGIRTILRSRRILLVASGGAKAPVLGKLFREQALDPMLPASMLFLHPDVTFLLDEAAASEIPKTVIQAFSC